jgi:hypothetical protein
MHGQKRLIQNQNIGIGHLQPLSIAECGLQIPEYLRNYIE